MKPEKTLSEQRLSSTTKEGSEKSNLEAGEEEVHSDYSCGKIEIDGSDQGGKLVAVVDFERLFRGRAFRMP